MLEDMAREAAGVGLNGNGTSIGSIQGLDTADDTVLANETGEMDEAVQEKKLTEFRLNIMQTQMVSYIRFRVECDEYTPVLQEINGIRDLHTKLEGKSFERGLSKHLWTGNTVCNILAQIRQSTEVEEEVPSSGSGSSKNIDVIEAALKKTELGSELEVPTGVVAAAGPSSPIPIGDTSESNLSESHSRSSIRYSTSVSTEDIIPVDSNLSPFNAESGETKKKTGFFSFLGMSGKVSEFYIVIIVYIHM